MLARLVGYFLTDWYVTGVTTISLGKYTYLYEKKFMNYLPTNLWPTNKCVSYILVHSKKSKKNRRDQISHFSQNPMTESL